MEAMQSLHHPWTLGLATGKTSQASFRKYIAQDAYFLEAFAKAYAYALTKVEDEQGVRAFHSLIGSVLEELSLHASYSMKWGVDLQNVSEVAIRRIVAIASVGLFEVSSLTAVIRRVFIYFVFRHNAAVDVLRSSKKCCQLLLQ